MSWPHQSRCPIFGACHRSQGARHLVHEFQAILGRKYRFNKLTTPNDLWILYQINICKPMLYKCRKHVSLYVYCIYFFCVHFIISLYIFHMHIIYGEASRQSHLPEFIHIRQARIKSRKQLQHLQCFIT